MPDSADIVLRLEAISEELTDMAMGRLRDGLEAGDATVVADEKRINKARQAVEKAAHLLRDASS